MILFKLKEYAWNIKKSLIPFLLLSMAVAGPFIVKAIYYSGVPLFPFAAGIFDMSGSAHRNESLHNSLTVSSKSHMSAKDAYGYGKSGLDFLKHFWLISVPDKGVNNRYDYPVGLVYLIFMGPFLYMFILALRRKRIRGFSFIYSFLLGFMVVWFTADKVSLHPGFIDDNCGYLRDKSLFKDIYVSNNVFTNNYWGFHIQGE